LRTFLGFDFGVKRIGIAVGQRVTGTANALCTVQARDNAPDWEQIGALIKEWRPHALVVGLPMHADGTDSAVTRAARRFAQQLEGRYRLPVYMIDERHSSQAAADLLANEQNSKAGLDAMAARIILQDWLDTETT